MGLTAAFAFQADSLQRVSPLWGGRPSFARVPLVPLYANRMNSPLPNGRRASAADQGGPPHQHNQWPALSP
jgi:hypothetical protein